MPVSDTSLAERGNPTSLPLRLPFEPLAIESRLGLVLGSVLFDDTERAVVCRRIGGFFEGGTESADLCSTLSGL